MSIGFLGLGAMGAPMAKNLLRRGVALSVSSRRPEVREAFSALGARVVPDAGALAECEMVFLCLSDTAAVEQVCLGEDGLVARMAPGALLCDFSTIDPEAAEALALACTRRGIGFLDAPVSGMAARAEDGTLTIMCGGSQDDFQRAKPYLDMMGSTVLHMGIAGCGQKAKLINQLLFDLNLAALAEILPLSVQMGLDPEQTAAVVNSGTGRSYASEFFVPRMLEGDFSQGYPLSAAWKDLVHARRWADTHQLTLPLFQSAEDTYRAALDAGLGAENKAAMVKVWEQRLGVRFRRN